MHARRTAWSSSASSLTSDRIPSSNAQRSRGSSPIPKIKREELEASKSNEVKMLEKLRNGLRSIVETAPVVDPKGGCFCQARSHKLSSYTPVCRHCGLILCEVNLPHHACPHCRSPLLSQDDVRSLSSSLEQLIDDTLEKEEFARQQAAEEARRAAGAFPVLGAPMGDTAPQRTTVSSTSQPPLAIASPKTVAKTAAPTAAKGTVMKQKEQKEPEPVRVPHPPLEVPVISTLPAGRPWMNAKSETVTYIAV
ncbi:hypothetical protein NM688_g6597 [Phlebia brevispora]|uniref:Uncharacterized protein n=1 Tax=Phlebia brevispora TaxID=194682 RepID=A0ACC1SE95_9APHY|nr:hypothetical protein NM688_g6597 [Phlebia brevispora]